MAFETTRKRLFSPAVVPSLIVAPSHIVIDGRTTLVMDTGWLADVRAVYGPSVAIDCGLRLAADNKDGSFGLSVIEDPVPKRSNGLGLFQDRYSWWESPRLDLITHSAKALAGWMDAHPWCNVRLGCPGIPHLTIESVMEILNKYLGVYKGRLEIITRVPHDHDES